jgi:ABC-2 type transport system ATP-binding protein
MSVGRLVAQGTLDEFRDAGEARVLVRTPDPGPARAVLARLGLQLDGADPSGADAAGEALVTARLGAAAVAPEAIVSGLVEAGVRVRGFDVERASLEQRFVELTGEGFDIVQ